jgi:hypothetical protein
LGRLCEMVTRMCRPRDYSLERQELF